MASNEEYHEALFPLQQETIARAALAGVRWERIEVTDWAWGDRTDGVRKRKRTRFLCYIGDAIVGEFEDIYECALAGLSVVETPERKPDREIEGFELREDNAQPVPAGRRASGIDYASLARRGLPRR